MTAPNKAQLTVVEYLYYQKHGESPVAYTSRSTEDIVDTTEQVWVREVNVPCVWTTLECGWVKECSVLLLENLSKDNLLGLSFGGENREADCSIPPGGSLRCCPLTLSKLALVCFGGTARCRITLFPR